MALSELALPFTFYVCRDSKPESRSSCRGSKARMVFVFFLPYAGKVPGLCRDARDVSSEFSIDDCGELVVSKFMR